MKKNLEDYVMIYSNLLSPAVCKKTIRELKKITWEEHHFYSVRNERRFSPSPGQELLTSHTRDISTHPVIMESIWKAIHTYIQEDMKFPWFPGWEGYTSVRWNKYSHNTKMKEHCDFIHSIFDGTRKGIPILSIVGALNEEYTGGEFIMYRDKEIKLKTGDILIFPSTFMYPHRVDPVKKGARYSYVSWVY
tara:strand:+ start:1301 stop:1873 length:573 start_codon:yes stop_codon:yes gene_type:complete